MVQPVVTTDSRIIFMKEKNIFTIGILSKRTDCKIETIRYYERIGIFPVPSRTEGGHRVYSEDHLKRLVFIRRSRELGFSLEDIRVLLKLGEGEGFTCRQVETITLHHLENIRQKLSDLKSLEKTLAKISSQCQGGKIPDCPILNALYDKKVRSK